MKSFNVNDICWDKANNEYVRVSNSGMADGSVECVAIRVVGMKKGRAITGWTYKKCDPNNLVITSDVVPTKFEEMVNGGVKRRTPYNVGRV